MNSSLPAFQGATFPADAVDTLIKAQMTPSVVRSAGLAVAAFSRYAEKLRSGHLLALACAQATSSNATVESVLSLMTADFDAAEASLRVIQDASRQALDADAKARRVHDGPLHALRSAAALEASLVTSKLLALERNYSREVQAMREAGLSESEMTAVLSARGMTDGGKLKGALQEERSKAEAKVREIDAYLLDPLRDPRALPDSLRAMMAGG
jgi:hypothetical protein